MAVIGWSDGWSSSARAALARRRLDAGDGGCPDRSSRPDCQQPGDRGPRRRLWRYRHLAALRRQAVLRGRRPCQQGQRLRRSVADRLVADRGRHGQICAGADARRQSRRGRHPGVDGAGDARRGGRVSLDPLCRAVRRRAILRRRGDNARDLGAERGRGPQGRDPRPRTLGAAADPAAARGAVHRAAPRHQQCRRLFRPGDDPMVRGHRGSGRA